MARRFEHIDEYGLLGSNYYFRCRKKMGLSEEDLAHVGVVDERVSVHPDLIQPLQAVDMMLQNLNLRLYVVEGYRSQDLYRLVQGAMNQKFGQFDTDRILNMKDMPHATGKSVDVAIWTVLTNNFVSTRDPNDKRDGYFVDFYKARRDPLGQGYHFVQGVILNLMEQVGFRLGTKREYFHFNFNPTIPRDY